MTHIALLRGINVGGRNLISMSDLRQVFEAAGFKSVRTYIQSGNVLFDAAGMRKLEEHVEAMLHKRFGQPIITVVCSQSQLGKVVDAAPTGFGEQAADYHYDVMFLKASVTAPQLLETLKLRDGVDQAWAGRGVVYFSRLSTRRTQSQLSRIVSNPHYKSITIRNWNTTTKLYALSQE